MQNQVDQSFVRNTMANNEDQIRLSEIAAEKSPSPDVKQFGQQMVKIHGQLEDELTPVARQLGVNAPKEPSKKEKKEIEKLQSLSGQQFDSAYLQDMGRMQQESMKYFETEAQRSQNTALRKAASQDELVLNTHFQMLKMIAEAHKIDLSGKEGK